MVDGVYSSSPILPSWDGGTALAARPCPMGSALGPCARVYPTFQGPHIQIDLPVPPLFPSLASSPTSQSAARSEMSVQKMYGKGYTKSMCVNITHRIS